MPDDDEHLDQLERRLDELDRTLEEISADVRLAIAVDPGAEHQHLPPRPENPCQCGCGCELHIFPGTGRDVCVWCHNDHHAQEGSA